MPARERGVVFRLSGSLRWYHPWQSLFRRPRIVCLMLQQPQAATPALPAATPTIPVELFGVPRLVAGERAVDAAGLTLAELAADLLRRQPTLAGRVLDPHTGWPLDGYSFVVDEQFTRDQMHPVHPGTSVLLVSSAAGG